MRRSALGEFNGDVVTVLKTLFQKRKDEIILMDACG